MHVASGRSDRAPEREATKDQGNEPAAGREQREEGPDAVEAVHGLAVVRL